MSYKKTYQKQTPPEWMVVSAIAGVLIPTPRNRAFHKPFQKATFLLEERQEAANDRRVSVKEKS